MQWSLLSYPYVPNRKNKKKMGRPTPYQYMHRIAYTETMRGDREDVPTLMFYGAPFMLLRDVCEPIFRMMGGRVKNLLIGNEHSCRWKNGKCYWRMTVQVVGLDEQFISFKEFVLMLISRMKRICNCTVRHYKLDTFVNL